MTTTVQGLRLGQPSIEPGGTLDLRGSGCLPSSPVQLSIGDRVLGTAVADGEGAFTARVVVPDLPLGPYVVDASCGPTLSISLDLAVATSADAGTGTLGVFLFFLLLLLMLFRRRHLIRRWGRAGREVTG